MSKGGIDSITLHIEHYRRLVNFQHDLLRVALAAKELIEQPSMSRYVSTEARNAEREGLFIRLEEALKKLDATAPEIQAKENSLWQVPTT